MSLSARRAWIEISTIVMMNTLNGVALRKESVDRNLGNQVLRVSAGVALRKESVDRNFRASFAVDAASVSLSARRAWIEIKAHALSVTGSECRSPQGERG